MRRRKKENGIKRQQLPVEGKGDDNSETVQKFGETFLQKFDGIGCANFNMNIEVREYCVQP